MHLPEDELEQYAMDLLPPLCVQEFEVHLLVCEQCQDRLLQVDLSVAALREACGEIRATAPARASR